MSKSPTVLCILDGVGLNPKTEGNAVALAKTPCLDSLLQNYPHSTLTTHGPSVGLPSGQMGNSEVGHLNIGGGRVVEQWLLRINREFEEKTVAQKKSYRMFLDSLGENSTIHLIGLYSDGGVHSHSDHLKHLLMQLCSETTQKIALHLFTDGRDTSPHRALTQVAELEKEIQHLNQVSIVTLGGRFYGMDRDKRWDRTERAYQTISKGAPLTELSPSAYIEQCYEQGTTDEFIEPIAFEGCAMKPDDAVIFWNFREDRMRQIVAALCIEEFSGFTRSHTLFPPERVLCFADYDETFCLPVLFEPVEVKNHLGEVVAAQGLRQLRVAETEKYPHVTYFLNGGIEEPYPGEDRKVLPSPRDVKTYDEKPEMSAAAVCETVKEGIRSGDYALIVVNFANCDMVGHTGVIEAAIRAVETVDGCLGQILDELANCGGRALIIADHGNAEMMINDKTGEAHTAHTTFPVPVIYFDPRSASSTHRLREGGALCDIAPTILKIMGISQPQEMTGRSLLELNA